MGSQNLLQTKPEGRSCAMLPKGRGNVSLLDLKLERERSAMSQLSDKTIQTLITGFVKSEAAYVMGANGYDSSNIFHLGDDLGTVLFDLWKTGNKSACASAATDYLLECRGRRELNLDEGKRLTLDGFLACLPRSVNYRDGERAEVYAMIDYLRENIPYYYGESEKELNEK